MKRIAVVLVVCVLIGGAVGWPAQAGDESSAEVRIAQLERRVAQLEKELVAMQAKLDRLLASRTPATSKPPTWTDVRDAEHMTSSLAAAAKNGQPAVVLVWASWCTYCKAYRSAIEKDAALRKSLENCVLLGIDVTTDSRDDLRKAAGIADGQPLLAFFDAQGNQLTDALILGWQGEKSVETLKKSLEQLSR